MTDSAVPASAVSDTERSEQRANAVSEEGVEAGGLLGGLGADLGEGNARSRTTAAALIVSGLVLLVIAR